MATHLGSLVQLCCGEGGTLQTKTAGTCGGCSQWMVHTGFATAQGSMYFAGPHCSGSSTLCKGTVPSGHCVRALPSSKLLRFSEAPQGHRSRWAVHFVLFPGPSSSGDWVFVEHPIPSVRASSTLPRPRLLSFPDAMGAQSQACQVSPVGS